MGYDIEKEKREAIEAGQRALHSLRAAQDNLSSARNWGLWDMFGGGTITSLIKSSKMDRAKQNMEQGYFSRRILFQYGEAVQDAACQTVYGTGQI